MFIEDIINQASGEVAVDAGLIGGMIAALISMVIVMSLTWIGIYIYSSIATMKLAKRMGHDMPGLVWIPLAGKPLVMSKLAKMHWWPVLLLLGMFIPSIGSLALIAFAVFMFIWMWKITEKRGMPGWIVLLSLVPFIGWIWALVLVGILAWKKD